MMFELHFCLDPQGQEGQEGPQVSQHSLAWGPVPCKFSKIQASSQNYRSHFEHMEEKNEWIKGSM